jgi:S-adenosylmethionine/arginine decarboxylase-like enzyme
MAIEMDVGFWGYHSLIDVSGCDHDAITSKETVKLFLEEVVRAIGMIAYGPAWVEHFATHDPEKAGVSGIQMIETSNITCHFVDKDNTGYIDVFSCKTYDTDVLDSVIKKFFNPSQIRLNFVYRQAPKA